MLRKRIAELQHYRRMGLTNAADIEKYENDVIKRVGLYSHQQTQTRYSHRATGTSENERLKGLLSRRASQPQDRQRPSICRSRLNERIRRA